MDPNEFNTKLAEIATVKTIKPARHNGDRANEEITQAKINGELITITQQYNPTLGIELVKLKPVAKLCELGCGKIVDNQVIEKRVSHYPAPHWKTKCVNCGCWLAPNGVDLLENSSKAQAAFLWHLRDKK